jgi:hypothetical protein
MLSIVPFCRLVMPFAAPCAGDLSHQLIGHGRLISHQYGSCVFQRSGPRFPLPLRPVFVLPAPKSRGAPLPHFSCGRAGAGGRERPALAIIHNLSEKVDRNYAGIGRFVPLESSLSDWRVYAGVYAS